MKRYGKLKVKSTYTSGPSAGSTSEDTYIIIEESFGESILFGYCPEGRVGDRFMFVSNIKSDDKMSLDKIFASNGEATYEWVVPMTQSHSNSGLTIDDIYPVGIEITTTDTAFNPMNVWGGTWTVLPTGAKRVWTRKA